jgi:hypothetical protein
VQFHDVGQSLGAVHGPEQTPVARHIAETQSLGEIHGAPVEPGGGGGGDTGTSLAAMLPSGVTTRAPQAPSATTVKSANAKRTTS